LLLILLAGFTCHLLKCENVISEEFVAAFMCIFVTPNLEVSDMSGNYVYELKLKLTVLLYCGKKEVVHDRNPPKVAEPISRTTA